MQIHCENCDTLIPASNINIQDKLAVCPACHTVFSFSETVQRRAKLRKMKRPSGMSVDEQDDRLEIRFFWRKILKWGEHWITGLMIALTVLLGTPAISTLSDVDSVMQGVVGAALLIGALVSLFMTVLILINQVRIVVDESGVSVENKPLPIGTHQIDRDEIVRVMCSVAAYNEDDPKSEFVDYDVKVECRDGHEVTLTTLRRAAAIYVAQMVENYLDMVPAEQLDAESSDEEPFEVLEDVAHHAQV